MLCHEQSEAEYAIDWERCEKARNQGTSIGSDYPKLSDLDPAVLSLLLAVAITLQLFYAIDYMLG